MTDPDGTDPGLCRTCRWARAVSSARGGRFVLCGHAAVDPDYPKYPALPVLACAAREPAGDRDGEST